MCINGTSIIDLVCISVEWVVSFSLSEVPCGEGSTTLVIFDIFRLYYDLRMSVVHHYCGCIGVHSDRIRYTKIGIVAPSV